IVSPLSNVAQSVSPKSTPRWSSPVRARAQASSETRSVTEANHSPFLPARAVPPRQVVLRWGEKVRCRGGDDWLGRWAS
ncbi:MAG: hypothetical protein QOF74_5152, partial [Caballeronia mineralivorans]|nr:hypothetical protein [Caballeronia mineralivorans]